MEILLKIDNFEGPLDLLLSLIEKKKVSIAEININQLINEYLEVIKNSQAENIEIKAEFIITASELIEIKALSLLNLEANREKEENLKRRLEEHKLFKEITPKISAMEKEFYISYSRGEGRRTIKKIARDYDLSFLSGQDIYEAYVKYYDDEKFKETLELNLEKKFDIKEVMDSLLTKIYFKRKKIVELFEEATSRLHLIYIFLGILELYKDGKINIVDGEVEKC